MKNRVIFKNVDEYIENFDDHLENILLKIRKTIKSACPEATEEISYGMPAYKLKNKPLIYFAAYEKHIGIYALPKAHLEFSSELAQYKQGKGSVQFPLNQPIPYDLIKKITIYNANKVKLD